MIKVLKAIVSGFYYAVDFAVDFLAYYVVKAEFEREQAEREERRKQLEEMAKNDKDYDIY